MSLFGKLWKRFRGVGAQQKRARRLFFEPLEGRQLLAAVLEVTKTDDSFGQPVIAGNQNPALTYTVTVTNVAPDDGGTGDNNAHQIFVSDHIPVHTKLNT